MGYGCDSSTLTCAATAWTYILRGRGFDFEDDDADDDANAEWASPINEVRNVATARLNARTFLSVNSTNCVL